MKAIWLQHFDAVEAYVPQLVYALLVIIIFTVIGRALAAGIRRGMRRAGYSETYEAFFLTTVRWIFILIGLFIAINILGFTGVATGLLAGGGVTAIVIGFAFRDIGENILAGFFLAFSRPFKINDLIRSEDLEGRVKSVDLRHTHIRTGDGCDIFIPSAQIFTKPLLNYTRDGLRRSSFTIGIDYGDDLAQASQRILAVMEENPRIIQQPAPKAAIKSFEANFVLLEAAFWINSFEKQESLLPDLKSEVMDTVRKELIGRGFTLSSSVRTSIDVSASDEPSKEQAN